MPDRKLMCDRCGMNLSQRPIDGHLALHWDGVVGGADLDAAVQRGSVLLCCSCMARFFGFLSGSVGSALPTPPSAEQSLDIQRERAELDAVELALRRFHGNVTQTARHLGVSRMTVYRLVRKHRLPADLDGMRRAAPLVDA